MKKKDIGLLLLWGLLLYMLGNWLLPVTDPVESNYVETVKEMIQAGDYMSPRIYGNYWYDKPIFFYWELIAAFQMFGFHDFVARFFPALFAILGILMTYAFGTRLYNRRTGILAAVLLGTSLEYWYLGHAIVTDMTLWVSVSLALICFYFGYCSRRPVWYYGAFAAAGIGVLTKGPIGLALPGLVILLFLLWQRRLSMLISRHMIGGMLLFMAIVAVWYYPMYQLHGKDFIDTFLGVHNVLRATVPEHPRNSVWYYYLMVYFGGFFPWSILLLPPFIKKLFKRQLSLPQESRERFLLVWAVAVFLAFKCMASKYITYTFPYMMPIALLMSQYFLTRKRLFAWTAGFMTIILLAGVISFIPKNVADQSGKELAAVLSQEAGPDTEIFIYGTRYPVSVSYYSGLVPGRLMTAERAELERPQKMSWTATNIMPFAVIEDMQEDHDMLLVTVAGREEDLGTEVPGSWQEIGRVNRYIIYRLVR